MAAGPTRELAPVAHWLMQETRTEDERLDTEGRTRKA